MAIIEYAIWGFFLFYPLYIYLATDKERKAIENDPRQRVKAYRTTILNLWWPTILLLLLVFNGNIDKAAIGIQWQWNLANQILIVITVVLSIYSVFVVKKVKSDEQARQSVLKQVDQYSYFLPTNKKELRLFTWGICITAGICEELLFRGYLLHLLSAQMPMYLAVVISSIIFGLPHIYQGFSGVIRTALFGLVFALIYLWTDSLLIPIVLHIIGDIYSGYLTFTATNGQVDATTNKLQQSAG